VSNLETEPAEVVCDTAPALSDVQILEPREVPLGGPRAMTVHRTLPQRGRSLIGAWCFVDHYGPDDVAATGGMVVPPHPHTGLQTVSWLFEGEIEHRDSVGSHALIEPGAVNLMTAGSGIQHSEVSTPGATVLHGAQLWIALPSASRDVAPFFEAHATSPVVLDDAIVRVFIGSLGAGSSPLRVFTPLLGAQIDLAPSASVTLDVRADFEHGVLLDTGAVSVRATSSEPADVPSRHLAYVAPGTTRLTLAAGPDGARILLLGGTPLGEQIVMWWNFIGRSHDDVVQYRSDWAAAAPRFGSIPDDLPRLPAPDLPTVRLKPRG
jgi:redox-sensitive bicupin YhaK (pirin superfamily)